MKQSMLLECPVSEYEARLARLTEAMRAEGLDAVLLTMPSNVRYFSGLRSIVWVSNVSMPGVLLINADGVMRVIGSESNNATARRTSCAEDDWFYAYAAGTALPNFSAALIRAMRDMRLESARVGMEYGPGMRLRMVMADYNDVLAAFPGTSFVDAASMLWGIRSVKSPLEQERLRKCSQINSRVFEEAFRHIVPGKTREDELYQFMASQYFLGGAESTLQLDVRGRSDRYGLSNCPPSWLPIDSTPGTALLLDGGPCIDGYYSDIIRVGVIGKPSSAQKELFEIAKEGNQVGLDAIRPGVTVGEVARKIDAFFDSTPAAEHYNTRGWSGHCVGLDVHEYPCLELGDETVIRPGMVFAVEPSVSHPELGCFCIEENVLVTENGVELLSDAPRELFEVG